MIRCFQAGSRYRGLLITVVVRPCHAKKRPARPLRNVSTPPHSQAAGTCFGSPIWQSIRFVSGMLRVRSPPEAPLPARESGCPCRCVLRVPNANISFGLLGITGRRRVNFLLRSPPATFRPLAWGTVQRSHKAAIPFHTKEDIKRFTALLSSFFISKNASKAVNFSAMETCVPHKRRRRTCHNCLWKWDLYDTGQWLCYCESSSRYHLSAEGGCSLWEAGISSYYAPYSPRSKEETHHE